MKVSFNESIYQVVRDHGFAPSDKRVTEAICGGNSKVFSKGPDGAALAFAQKIELAGQNVFILGLGKELPSEGHVEAWFAIIAPGYLETLGGTSPLELLEAFSIRFGLPFVIEGKPTFFATNLPTEIAANGTPRLDMPISDGTASFLVLTVVNPPQRSRYFQFCLDMERYTSWRTQTLPPSTSGDVSINVHPALQGHATPFSFCDTNGLVFLSTKTSPSDVIAFDVRANNYSLTGEVRGGNVVLTRNGLSAIAQIATPAHAGDEVLVGWQWSLEQLRTFSLSKASKVDAQPKPATLSTAAAAPPPSLITWVRSFVQQQRRLYDKPFEIYTVITALFAGVEETIRYTDMQDAFWDAQREGKKITGRRPKRETTSHRIVDALLRDAATLKNIAVVAEPRAEAGNVDFMMLGTLITGQQVPVCVEFKNAHASNLLHGVETQLPAYMRSKGADFGVFGVFYFRSDEFDEPKQTVQELAIELEAARVRTGLNIKILIWNLSPPRPPSIR